MKPPRLLTGAMNQTAGDFRPRTARSQTKASGHGRGHGAGRDSTAKAALAGQPESVSLSLMGPGWGLRVLTSLALTGALLRRAVPPS